MGNGGGVITRVDGGERTPVGDVESIQDRQMLRTIKQNAGGQAIDPSALMAIRDNALTGGGVTAVAGVIQPSAAVPAQAPIAPTAAPAVPVAPVAPVAPEAPVEPVAVAPVAPVAPVAQAIPEAPTPVSAAAAGQDRIAQIMARAKKRLTTAAAGEGKADRYKPDSDEGRKYDEGPATKDKYFPDYAKGRDALKKLKANLALKLNKVSGLVRKAIGTKAYAKLKSLRKDLRAELAIVAGVAEDVRMKEVSYSPEKDPGRQDEATRAKDKRMGPDTNPINNQLSKMWSNNAHMPKVAENIYDPEGDEGKDTKGTNKEMGGNGMKTPPKDKGTEDRKDAPKGKEKSENASEQIKNLQNAVKELEKKDDDFAKEIDVLTEAVEGFGGKPKVKGKDKAPKSFPVPAGKSPLGGDDFDAPSDLGAPKARSSRGRVRTAKARRSLQLRKKANAGPRRGGNPRTDEERLERHKDVHPTDDVKSTKDLPARGTGRGPGAGGGRRGNPRTDEERVERHKKVYPKDKTESTKDLPPRGTGIGKSKSKKEAGFTAEFVREASKLYSHWTVKDPEGKTVLKATAKDAFGKETFAEWEFFASKGYGSLLLKRMRSQGLKAVAAEMHVRPIMTKEAMRVEIIAKKSGGKAALTKKITNEKAYYSEAYGDSGYAGKLVKKRTQKPSGQTMGKGKKGAVENDNIVIALNRELEAENARLRNQVAAKADDTERLTAEKKVEAAKNQEHKLNEAMRIRAERSIALVDRMAQKGLIENSELSKKAAVDNMMDMDDLGFRATETMVERQVIARLDEVEKSLTPKASIVRTGGLSTVPATPVKSESFQQKLEGIWSKKQPSTQTK